MEILRNNHVEVESVVEVCPLESGSGTSQDLGAYAESERPSIRCVIPLLQCRSTSYKGLRLFQFQSGHAACISSVVMRLNP